MNNTETMVEAYPRVSTNVGSYAMIGSYAIVAGNCHEAIAPKNYLTWSAKDRNPIAPYNYLIAGVTI